jgi:flagellar biosynthesis protein FliR
MDRELIQSVHHVLLPASIVHHFVHAYALSPMQVSGRTRIRVSKHLILALALSLMIMPTAALDEPHSLSHASAGGIEAYQALIGICTTITLLIGQRLAAFSSTLIGPSMGVTSLLWLIMRNDPAIDPKASWT